MLRHEPQGHVPLEEMLAKYPRPWSMSRFVVRDANGNVIFSEGISKAKLVRWLLDAVNGGE